MAKITEEEEVPARTKEVEYTVCDKCHGRFHEKTQFPYEDLNQVVFGAEAKLFRPSHSLQNDRHVAGEHHYFLCDRCHEKAHDYLSDFF